MRDRDGEREEMKRICEAHSGGTDRQGREERERRCLFAAAAFDIIEQRRRGNIPRKDRKVGTSNAVVSSTVDHSCCASTGKSDKVTFDQRAMRLLTLPLLLGETAHQSVPSFSLSRQSEEEIRTEDSSPDATLAVRCLVFVY